MAARKNAKKAIGKKKTSSKSTQPVPSASLQQAELDELKAKYQEELAQLKRMQEDVKRAQDLARINQQMAAGVTPTVVTESPPEEDSELEAELARKEEERVAREREEAREQRRLRRLEEKQRAREQAAQPPAAISNIEDARAKRAKPAAPEKEPVSLPMDELHKYKLATFNRAYQDAVEKLKGPLVQKYNQLLNAELQKTAENDPECIKARRDQIACINELVKLLDPQLPEGYAITQCMTDKGVVVAQYVPDRAGKPLPLPEELAPKEG